MRSFLSFIPLLFLSAVSLAEVTSSQPLRLTITKPNTGDPSVSKNVQYKGFTRRCDRFIGPDGQLGSWGQSLQKAIRRVGQDCFFNKANFSVLCPSFNEFSDQRKMQFLAFMFGTLAYDESSCHKTARAQGTNGIADGLFQLEYSQRLRKGSGRDRIFCATDRGVNSQDITFQMECTASIFRDGYCRRNNVPGRDFWYWEKLNGTHKVVSKHCGISEVMSGGFYNLKIILG